LTSEPVSASQEIPRILWNPKVHYRIHKRTSALSSPYPHIPLPEKSILMLSSHLRLGLLSGLFPSGSLTEPSIRLSSPLYALHAVPISFEKRPPIWRVAANILNKQTRRAEKRGGPPAWVLGVVLTNPHRKMYPVTKYLKRK